MIRRIGHLDTPESCRKECEQVYRRASDKLLGKETSDKDLGHPRTWKAVATLKQSAKDNDSDDTK